MTDEEWLRDTLEGAVRIPSTVHVDVDAVVIRGRRHRRRRSTSVTALGALILATVIGMTTAVADLHVGAIRNPAATSGGLTAPYWYASVTDEHDAVMHGTLVHEAPTAEQFWLGHDQPSLSRGTSADPRSLRGLVAFSIGFIPDGPSGPLGDPSVLHSSPAWDGDGKGNFSWAELWRLPTDPIALQAYFDAYKKRIPQNMTVFGWAANLLEDPGPTALHVGLADLIAMLPGTTVGRGVDSLGRRAEILTAAAPFPQFDATGGSDRVFVDPTNGKLLQFDQIAGKPHYPKTDLPMGAILDRRVYLQLGPVATAPTTDGTPAATSSVSSP